MKRGYETTYPVLLLFLFGLWILLNPDIYLDAGVYLSRDNAHSHLPSFANIINQIKFFKSFPDWYYSKQGGIWVAPFSNLLGTLLPHRFLGYFLGVFTNTHTNLIYKVSFLIFGQSLYLIGSYFFLKLFLKSNAWAFVITILSFFTSNGISFLHQEASFGTVFFLPFIWICLIKLKESPIWFIPLSACLGYSLNIYYPQIQVSYWTFVILAFGLLWPRVKNHVLDRYKVIVSNKKIAVFGLLLLFITASPLLFSYSNYWNRIASPLRDREEGLAANSYNELITMQSKRCNIDPRNLGSYFGITQIVADSLDPQDMRSLFVGPAGIVAVLLLLYFRLRKANTLALLVTFLALLSMGFYGFAPRLLWWWVPGMKMFRQYYHFIEIFNVHLILLAAFLAKEFIESIQIKKRIKKALCIISVACVFAINYQWTVKTIADYRESFKTSLVAEGIFEPRQFTSKEFAEELLSKQEYTYEAGVKTLKPRGISHSNYEKLWDTVGGVHLKTGKVLVPNKGEDLSYDIGPNGIEISILRAPGNPNSLEILQFNDGNWGAFDSQGKPLKIQQGYQKNVSIPDVYSGMRVIVNRGSTWGGAVILLSFVGLVFSWTTVFLKEVGLNRFFSKAPMKSTSLLSRVKEKHV